MTPPAKAALRAAALLVLMAVAGLTAVRAAPADGSVIGIWPVGLASAAVVVAGRRWVPVLLPVVLAAAVLTIWLGGRPLDVALGYSLGITAETWVAWRVLTRGRDAVPALRTDRDLAVFVVAVLGAGGVAAVTGFLTSAATGFGTPWFVGLALGTAHLASQIILLPMVCRLPTHGAVAPPVERVAQWLLIAVVTPLVFLPTDFPSVVFLIVPLLAWGALRNRPWEALAQLVAVVGVAIVMTTSGMGPFHQAPDQFGLAGDTRGVLLAAFAVSCGLIVLTLVLRVGVNIETARGAAAERDRLRNIVNGTPGVVIVGTDRSGRVTLFNPGAELLLGYEAAEVMGRDTTMFHTPQMVHEMATELGVAEDFAAVARRLADPDVGPTTIRWVRKDGVERDHLMTVSRISDERGQVLGYVCTSEDVTERLRVQGALEEALVVERRAVERLQEVDAVKDSFVSSVSHELRTPITSIVGYLELLEAGDFGELNAGQARAVARVAANSTRLLGLIDDLLTLSRVQADGLGMTDRAFDLREAVRAGYDVVAPSWQVRDLHAVLALPPQPVSFVGDRDMVERVVVNLVGNAAKFTPDGGELLVELRAGPTHAQLLVRDTGIGIPAAEQERLFTRFFRSSNAQQHAIPGSGLGLSIARSIVEQHQGTITVDSSPGVGTTFRVRLPVVG